MKGKFRGLKKPNILRKRNALLPQSHIALRKAELKATKGKVLQRNVDIKMREPPAMCRLFERVMRRGAPL